MLQELSTQEGTTKDFGNFCFILRYLWRLVYFYSVYNFRVEFPPNKTFKGLLQVVQIF